ncbi:LysR family transcriptional regulator [Leifsonia sp. 1010]|uniref:LysR family transcriptional regulator n=1 Tax=Leifsonia sp. 1010 TaxID=2817769 RepID=UPI00285D7D9C|nr:LysR family transcriptional regulator [Leifsonia sp. 1010]MDR6612140.1 DNA-binding transcriptional LysR family regulator [Leifsonia sp. 1010]
MPSLRALACLVAVADAGSITEAARSLYLSQPAVSHHLLQLEQEAGVALIVRETRGVRLTPAGRAALVEARRAVDAADAALPAAAAAARATGGAIRIGCAQSLVTVLAPVLVDWHRRRPDVLLTVREFTTVEEVTARLDGDEVDVVVMPGPAPARFVGTALGNEEIVLVTSADHSLAGTGAVERHALDGASLVHYAPENSLSGWLDQAFARSGVRPVVIMRTAVTAAAPQLAAAGLGVAVCPASAVPAGLPGAVLPFSPIWTRELVATTRTTPHGLVAHLLADLRHRLATSTAHSAASPADAP